MLDKLGSALKSGMKKISNAIFVDKKLIDGIVKDIQRALIEADVNVELVFALSQKIKNLAYDETIKGIDKKEQLVKLIHDEISLLLGQKTELKLPKKASIMFMGLYGAGKCVHKKCKIQLTSGEIISAENLYNRYISIKSEKLNDGELINVENKKITVPSFNPKTCRIENKEVTHLWKLKKEDLIEVHLDNGNDYSIKVTPEHPFFVLREGNVIQIKAEEITPNDFVAIPQKYTVDGKTINLFNDIKKLNLSTYLSQEEIKNILKKEDKNLKEIHSKLKNKVNYCCFTSKLKKGKIPLELINKINHKSIRLKSKNGNKIITFPLYLTKEFSEFIGYLIGDGHIEKSYIEITNEDPEIIERITELSKILFNLSPSINKDKRTKNLYQIRLVSTTLVELMSIFNLTPGKKGRSLKIPKQILKSDNETARNFIQAYFDCDSYPSKNRRHIEISSESQSLLKELNMLLYRFEIVSSFSKKEINNREYFRLSITAKNAERYNEIIGYKVKRKQDASNNYKKIGLIQGSGKQDMIPMGKSLKQLRLNLGFSIGEIQNNAVYSYGIYEKKGFISREKLLKLFLLYISKEKGKFNLFLNDIKNDSLENHSKESINSIIYSLEKNEIITKTPSSIELTTRDNQILKMYKNFDSQSSLANIKNIVNSDVSWIQVKNTNKIKNDSEYVYDLTVKDNHSFIAEGIIIHNTTTIAKLGFYYAKRGRKVALLGLDTQRPAAMDQLEQMAKKAKLPVFIDKKEKDPIKIIKQYAKELKKYDLVLIDTAGRDGLNKELIKEIEKLDKTLKPDYRILVMPADIGQAAKTQAEEFQKALSVDGVIITRMDGTSKAGGALTACAETKAQVFFIGIGEQIHEIEIFDPESFISRLLGMGDLNALLEHVKSATDEKQQKRIEERMQEGKFTLLDLYGQLEQMNKLGSMDKMLGMIPGMNAAKVPKDVLAKQEKKMAHWKNAISSMTEEEIENPEVMEKQTSRIQRIAKGSGTTTTEIRELLKQYKMIKDMMGMSSAEGLAEGKIDKKMMQKMAKRFKGKIKI
ncbi:MAG: signal recognition particle receptor subunit alpha [Nanoarchaeota archaeon]|nr:signal recognition particle receptor subunit alpha [Nanoarchaeota archaeon]